MLLRLSECRWINVNAIDTADMDRGAGTITVRMRHGQAIVLRGSEAEWLADWLSTAAKVRDGTEMPTPGPAPEL